MSCCLFWNHGQLKYGNGNVIHLWGIDTAPGTLNGQINFALT